MASSNNLVKPRSLWRAGLTPALIALFSILALGQTASRPDRGIHPAGTYAVSDIENVNLTNGNVGLHIPLAALPPVAGGKLSWALQAIYNSKLWDVVGTEVAANPPLQGYTQSTVQLSNSGGWSIGGIYTMSLHNVNEDYAGILPTDPNDPETTLLRQYVWKMVLMTPDGATHELRPLGYPSYPGSRDWARGYFKDTPRSDSLNTAMRYYSFDGSFLYATIDPFPVGSWPSSWTVYLPDGTRISHNTAGTEKITDTNGNKIKIYADVSGNVTTTHYQDLQTLREIKLVCNCPPGSAPSGQIQYQTFGGTWVNIDISYELTHVQGYVYPTGDPCGTQGLIDLQTYVIQFITLPQSDTGARQYFQFTYNSDATDPVNFQYRQSCGVNTTVTQASHGLGELSQMITPNGATVNYHYQLDRDQAGGSVVADVHTIPREPIVSKTLSHDGTTDLWTYSIGFATGQVTGPDGSLTTETFYSHDPGVSSYVGASKAGLVYRSNQSSKVLVERQWAMQQFSGGDNNGPGGVVSGFNPLVTAEFTSLLDSSGNAVKMKARTLTYDYNGNLTQASDYDWFDPSLVSRDQQQVPTAVPASAILQRTSTTSYYNPATTASSANIYANRVLATAIPLILSAPQELLVGTSDTRLSYDNQAYGTAPTVGNLTTESHWDNVASRWLDTTYGYDSYGNRASMTDPNHNLTTLGYDANTHAQPVSVTVDPLNGTGAQSAQTTYDYATGVVLSQTDTNGQMTSYNYTNQLTFAVDVYGRPGIVTNPQGRKVVTFYSDNARQVESRADLRAAGDGLLRSKTSSDNLGRVVQVQSSEDGVTYNLSSQTIYQQMGRITMTSNPSRNLGESTDGWTRTSRDEIGRVTEVASFSGSPSTPPPSSGTNGNWTGSVTSGYNANQVTVTDHAGKARQSLADGLGRLIQVIEDPSGLNYATSYGYDGLDDLTQVSQGSQSRTFVYSSLKRLRSATNPESGTINYTYDDDGNLKTRTDARGVLTTFNYDGLNRVTSRSYSSDPQATPTVSYSYDTAGVANAKGRLTQVSSSVSSYSYGGYDALGRVQSSTQTTAGQAYPISYSYDLAGNLTSQTYPSGRVVLSEYDAAGRLAGVKNQASGLYYAGGAASDATNRLQYTAPGAVSVMKLGNGKWEHTNFNSRLQPTQIGLGTSSSDSSILRLDYGYGTTTNNGNLLTQNIVIGGTTMSQSYGYDGLNRLQSASESGSWSQSYSYDRYGNRAVTAGYVPNTTLTPQSLSAFNTANNRLTASGYDTAGNQTQDAAGRSFLYDGENRQVSFNNGATTYSYDGDGRRVKKVDSSGTTVFVYNAQGQMIAEYVSGNPTASGTSYLTDDHLGSTRVVTDANGAVKSRRDYLPFGEEMTATAPGVRNSIAGYFASDGERQRFTGKERDDESGLDYFGARYCSSAQGRFTSADPITVTPPRMADPQQLNLYTYVRNNPLGYVDPTGMLIDTSRLSQDDLKQWQKIVELANKKDSSGNYVNPKLHEVFDKIKGDNRTFFIENHSFGDKSPDIGQFSVTKIERGNQDFSEGEIWLDFKKVEKLEQTASADQVPDFNKFEGLLGDKNVSLRDAELFGHEASHAIYAINNPVEAVQTTLLMFQRDTAVDALPKKNRYPVPPDVQKKIDDAAKGVNRTEKFAQQAEKIVNGELRSQAKH